jgi:hypothetical protein
MSTGIITDLQRTADQAHQEVHDPEAMRQAIEEMRNRLIASSDLGSEPFAARIVRQFRGDAE